MSERKVSSHTFLGIITLSNAPFTMQCTTCGEFIGKGRKFK
ncbi:hypothetical protein CGMCC3_g8908 [Colletotrichum fructicola]|nr:uncharacterized protein CGMCC3_g8908 [Colletotrichum fructicola]KAE9575063.1 hypothetical protein CGMCC3_g8908 [Colletotrichum fructicola]